MAVRRTRQRSQRCFCASEMRCRPASDFADQELLKAIRQVAVEHEVRRSAILAELQSLAASAGLLSGPAAPLAHETSRRDTLGFAIQHEGRSTTSPMGALPAASFEEKLRYHLNGRMN